MLLFSQKTAVALKCFLDIPGAAMLSFVLKVSMARCAPVADCVADNVADCSQNMTSCCRKSVILVLRLSALLSPFRYLDISANRISTLPTSMSSMDALRQVHWTEVCAMHACVHILHVRACGC